MYKLLIPVLALVSALACDGSAPENNAEELRTEAATAKVDADQAAADADAKSKVAAEATKQEWREYQRESWNPEWDRFYVSTEPKYETPDYTLERKDDSIRVTRKGADGHGRVEDAILANFVNAQFGTDKDVKAKDIDVQVIDNVVHLRGTVSSKAEAAEAVRLAINTQGVHDVVSHLKVKQ